MWYFVYFRQLIAALLSLSMFFAVTNRYKACTSTEILSTRTASDVCSNGRPNGPHRYARACRCGTR